MSVIYSVVIPVKDEEGNIEELLAEVEPVMEQTGAPWELIVVDDGSKDQTLAILERLKACKTFLRVVVFSKNFGQSSAFDAGFKAARGTYLISMDGDRQNDPQDIPKLIAAVQHYDMVCGIRQKRKDTFFKKSISFVANRIRSAALQDGVQDTGCSLKIYRKECIERIKLYHGMHRFLPALFQIEGFRVGQIPVHHRPRAKGKTKYHLFNRSFNTVADLLAVRWMRKRRLHYQIVKEVE